MNGVNCNLSSLQKLRLFEIICYTTNKRYLMIYFSYRFSKMSLTFAKFSSFPCNSLQINFKTNAIKMFHCRLASDIYLSLKLSWGSPKWNTTWFQHDLRFPFPGFNSGNIGRSLDLWADNSPVRFRASLLIRNLLLDWKYLEEVLRTCCT